MDYNEYEMMARLTHEIPPKQETPKGQKFHIGEIVKIIDDKNHPCRENTKDKLAKIEYSYAQKYRQKSEIHLEHDLTTYSLIHLWEDNSSAWWDEDQLELVKGIDEINEEKDKAEYERLKKKYEGKE